MITKCSRKKALEILQDPIVAKEWGVLVDDIKDTSTLYLVNDCVLLCLQIAQNVAEAHIAVKYRDRAKARPALLEILDFFQSCGIEQAWTTAPENRTGLINMLKKLGFSKQQDKWVFKWV